MKLLLTSAGLTNRPIAKALVQLAGIPASKIRLAFIPTAANVEGGDKGWLIDNLHQLNQQGYQQVDIVDISAVPRVVWEKRLKEANVLFFGGGNTFHLMNWMRRSGLDKVLPSLLKTRVYVGLSAGSCVAGPSITALDSELFFDEKAIGSRRTKGLGFVDLHFIPHLNSTYFKKVRAPLIKKLARQEREKVYALDDQCAIMVNGKKMKIVGTGKHVVFNE